MNKPAKKTLIPELRFPEFQDKWVERKLDDVFEEKCRPIKMEDSKDYSLVTVKRRYGGVVSRGVLKGEAIKVKSQFLLSEDDFLISKRQIVHNACGVVPQKLIGSIVSNEYSVLCSRPGFSIGFLNYFSQQPTVSNSFLLSSIGIHIEKMLFKLDWWLKLEFLFPSPAEQQKIADCLSSLDELIEAHTEKLAALKEHKKGLMQNLFPADGQTIPKLRFPKFKNAPEWEEKVLEHKDVGVFVKDRVSRDALRLKTYISTDNLLPDYAGVNTASKLPPSGSFTQYIKGDVLVSNIRPYLKKVWSANVNGASSNDVIVIRAGGRVSSEFLACLLRNDSFINYVMEGAKGVKMPRGDISSIKQYPILFPGSSEQQKIADCLTSLDDRVAAQADKIEELKAHKKGLMQQLFPSTDAEVEA